MNPIKTLTHRKEWLALAVLIVITVAVRVPGVFNRAIWYDESITLLETAGNFYPEWSTAPTPAATQKELLVGSPTVVEISRGLRETDVHPPLYYGLLSVWRTSLGGSIEVARFFSVLWSTASVIILFLLLRASGFARPLIPSLVYALSSGAVHYGHEARNYSLAMFCVLLATICAFLAVSSEGNHTHKFRGYSLVSAIFCGLAFQSNYLSIFPVSALLLWYAAWIPKRRRLFIIPTFAVALLISLTTIGTTVSQIGARPNQFQKALGFGQEIFKIIGFNFTIFWNPVSANIGVIVALTASVLAMTTISLLYVFKKWPDLDKRLASLMVGLSVAPSLGVLLLDLIFSKDLGKSSYVLFAGPALAYLLTLALGEGSRRDPGEDVRSAAGLSHLAGYAVALLMGLQLTGINFDLERTPGYAGSTLRSLAARIEASSPEPMVLVGAGHGRGDPASLIYELAPETTVSVIDSDTDASSLASEIATHENVWMVFSKGRMTSDVEDELFEDLVREKGYRVVSKAKRTARLVKKRRVSDSR